MLKGLTGPLRLLALLVAAALALAVFVVPYHVAVAPTVSQSYRVGFNNHAALLLFLGAALLLSVATGGFTIAKAEDRRLPRWWLVAGVLLTLSLCAIWRIDRAHKALGSESHYQLNRQAQMVGGMRLYRDLEFIYGPLLEYPGYWLQAGLHWSPLRAYMTSWVVDWLLGTAMLWCMVAWTNLPTRYRWVLFVFLDAFTLLMLLPSEGTHYTPLRVLCAGFLSVAVATYWRRTHAPYRTAAVMVGAIACGFAVSPEQGTALALGLSAYALLLGWKNRAQFPVAAAAIVPIGAAAIVAGATGWGVLRSMHGFAQGGNNFPLLPSPANVIVLGVYLCAIAAFYRVVLEGDWDSAAVSMGLCGIPMLSSAFGRCDLQHLTSAMPLLLLGFFWLAGRRWTFAIWLVLGTYSFFNAGTLLYLAQRSLTKARHDSVALPAPLPQYVKEGVPVPAGQEYFAPFALPVGLDGRARWGASSGYYFGLQNVLTPEDINTKANEIRKRHAPFLLLPDNPEGAVPLFWLAERDVNYVRMSEGSAWAPQQKRPLPSTQAMTDAIESEYVATDSREDGWRVWKRR